MTESQQAIAPESENRQVRWTAKAIWRDIEWWVVGFAFLFVIVIGTRGFLLSDDSYSVADALYRAVQLFALNSGDVNPPVPVLLQAARVLAPLTASYAAISALGALWRDQWQVAKVRMFTRDHTIIAGLGNKGLKLATSFQKAGFRVVVIERDPNNLLIERCREAEIPVIRGDARDPIVLSRGRLTHARQFIVTCDDATNLDVILASRAVLGGRTNSAALFVHLNDDNLGRFLKAELLEGSSLLPFRLEFFNVYDTAARTLARQAGFSRSSAGSGAGPHIWIVGLDGVGESLVLHLAGQWLESRSNGDKLPFTVIGPSIEGRVEQLFLRHPELRTVCDLAVKDVPFGRALLGLSDESSKNDRGSPTLIYVCLEDEAEGLATTLALRSRDRFADVATMLVLEDDDGGIGNIVRAGQSLQGVETFGFLSDALEPWALLLGANEVIAQARHQVYVDRERASGVGPTENPSAVPWEELDEDLKEANRDYADGIGAMVAAVNGAVVPAPLVRAEGPLVRFTDEEIERLSRMEHERWCRDRIRRGWRPTSSAKDIERKLHPLLVPWDELPEINREKDRDSVRELPEFLASVGFGIERP